MLKTKKFAAVILAGGQAKRLDGIAKGNIKIKNHTIIEHLILELKKAGLADIAISANNKDPYKQYSLPIIKDEYVNIGPIAGIVAALEYYKNYDAIITIPCDLPNITHKEITKLKNSFNDKIVYAQTDTRPHPLCATIPTSKLNKIIRQIEQGKTKIINIWNNLSAKPVDFLNETKFYNINRPALIWVITGAGRGVGKSTLAHKLTAILPHCIYAKYGHGKYNPEKQPSYFTELRDILAFIEQNRYLKQHIIVEANAVALIGHGDIKIFIDAIPNKTNPRKDIVELKQAANLVISQNSNAKTWQQQLPKNYIDKNGFEAIISIFEQQQDFIKDKKN